MTKLITGLLEIEKNLAGALNSIEELSVEGILEAAHEIVNRSKELTPVDTGTLQAAQFAEPVEGGARIDVRTEYALYVHEDMEAYHETGKAKFLETAIMEKRDRVLELAQEKAKVKK